MSTPITTFFSAWQLEDASARLNTIASAVTTDIEYDDPRTQTTLKGINELSNYVGMFITNAPGWSAKVVASDTTAGMTRATVAFGGPGPDGKAVVQHGQYFVETNEMLITRMVGFVGTGTPE